MKIRLAAAMVGLTVTSVAAHADPSGTVTKLMNAPVSLFSFGLYQLNLRLDAFVKGLPTDLSYMNGSSNMSYSAVALYKWEENRIYLQISADGGGTDADFENRCASMVKDLRRNAGVKVDGTPMIPQGSHYAFVFWPKGYSTNNPSESEMPNIDQIIEISYMEVNEQVRECTAPLLGTGYSIKRT